MDPPLRHHVALLCTFSLYSTIQDFSETCNAVCEIRLEDGPFGTWQQL